MIPRRYIEEWKEFAPWQEDGQVEQDLIIEKVLLLLFSDPFLQKRLAFRGGTALHKLYLKPQVRYSEDIDLVQIKAEPIKDTISAIRDQLGFLGKPAENTFQSWDITKLSITLITAGPAVPIN